MLSINKKCLCKKHIYDFKKGKYYEIVKLDDTGVILRYTFVNLVYDYGFDFNIDSKKFYPHLGIKNFYDYFCSEKEERQLKLKKLNNI